MKNYKVNIIWKRDFLHIKSNQILAHKIKQEIKKKNWASSC